MSTDIALNAAIRSNLLALSNTQELVARTQNRLSTGLKVASPMDDARAYFQARSLSTLAGDMSEKKDGVDQAISSLSTALNGVEAIDKLVAQMKGIAISAKGATGNELTELVAQYNTLRTQINNLARDAAYQGLNLINGTGTTLAVSFSKSTASILNIASVDLRVTSLGLNVLVAANFSIAANVDSALKRIEAALQRLQGKAQALGSNIAVLQTRLDFTKRYVNTLEEGSGKFTLADINEEGANLVALQIRQQLGIQALAFAGQSEQAVLQLFR
jgi:flagellin